MFISLRAQRNEPKKRHTGVIVLRSHRAISREFQTHPLPPPYELPVREMPCSTGDSSGDKERPYLLISTLQLPLASGSTP